MPERFPSDITDVGISGHCLSEPQKCQIGVWASADLSCLLKALRAKAEAMQRCWSYLFTSSSYLIPFAQDEVRAAEAQHLFYKDMLRHLVVSLMLPILYVHSSTFGTSKSIRSLAFSGVWYVSSVTISISITSHNLFDSISLAHSLHVSFPRYVSNFLRHLFS